MRQVSLTILLLSLSNVFMTFAWYAHLKELSAKPWLLAALASWGVAFFEYMEPLKQDYLWAGMCILGAAWFIFRGRTVGA